MIRSKKALKAARGQNCQVQVAGVCNGNPETTVAAHIQYNGGIMGGKTDDHAIAFACHDCHAFLDGHAYANHPEHEHDDFYKLRGVLETQKILIEMGIFKID